MNKIDLLQKTLVLLNRQSSALDDEMRGLGQLDITRQVVDFGQLEAARPALEKLVHERELDFLLFAQNDQVLDKKNIGGTIRALRAGYSSFSGIDDSMYLSQTRQCLGDFIAGQANLDLPLGASLQSTWQPGSLGFSLIFDTEQMGGVRFGLPRILDLLETYRAPATFFVTGFVATIYPDLLPTLRDKGHSIGIHGQYHEYLSDLDLPTQIQRIKAEKERFERHARVRGANLIFRMNENTVEALVACGFDYFVVLMQHIYFPFAYRKMPVQPLQVWTARGSIWMVPVSVETYNHPLIATRFAIDSAINQARREQAPAVNVLTHPFEIGSLRHIRALEKLLKYLQSHQSLEPATIDHIIEHLPHPTPSAYIYVTLGDGLMAGYGGLPKNGLSNWQWHHFSKYWQRVGHLYTSLKRLGYTPALCLSCPPNAPVFAVYPHLPDTPAEVVSVNLDPIAYDPSDRKLLSVLDQYANGAANKIAAFSPGSLGEDVKGVYAALHPKRASDWLGLLPEVTIWLVNRLTGSRRIF